MNIQSDDPAALTEALVWAKKTYEQLRRLPVKSFPASGAASPQDTQQQAQPPEHPPVCEVHQVPMVWVRGKKGSFWSCHERMPDGSWCSYKPPR